MTTKNSYISVLRTLGVVFINYYKYCAATQLHPPFKAQGAVIFVVTII